MTTERPQTSMTNAELAAAISAAHAQLSFPYSIGTSSQTDAVVRAHLEALQREQRDRACVRVDAGIGALKAGEASAAAVSAAIASPSGDASPQRMSYIAGKVLEIAGRLAAIRTIGDMRNCVLKEEQRGRLYNSLQAIETITENLLTCLDELPIPAEAKAYGASTMERLFDILNEGRQRVAERARWQGAHKRNNRELHGTPTSACAHRGVQQHRNAHHQDSGAVPMNPSAPTDRASTAQRDQIDRLLRKAEYDDRTVSLPHRALMRRANVPAVSVGSHVADWIYSLSKAEASLVITQLKRENEDQDDE